MRQRQQIDLSTQNAKSITALPDASTPTKKSPGACARRPTAHSRILVVDDDAVLRESLVSLLAGEGYHCHGANDALEAFHAFESGPFDAALLDIALPLMDGRELLRRLKQVDEDIAIVMLTACADVHEAMDYLRAGACDYIVKPFASNELFTALDRALTNRALAIENRRYGEALEERLRKGVDELTRTRREVSSLLVNTIQSLVLMLEARDKYTEGHSWKVALLAADLARELKMDTEFVENISVAGLLHDLGKTGVPDAVLNKPGALSDEEYALIKMHPVTGEGIIAPLDPSVKYLAGIRHHHERWDGKGYPDGIAGERVPLQARILALADSYDAITSERAYRPARSRKEAIEIVRECAGTQFDPALAAAFAGMLERRSDPDCATGDA